jgi:hypothetical protein
MSNTYLSGEKERIRRKENQMKTMRITAAIVIPIAALVLVIMCAWFIEGTLCWGKETRGLVVFLWILPTTIGEFITWLI